MIIDGQKYSFTQPSCTHCWVEEHSVPDDEGGALIRIPVAMTRDAWEDRLAKCCKCGRATTSGIYIRIDPSTVDHPSPEED